MKQDDFTLILIGGLLIPFSFAFWSIIPVMFGEGLVPVVLWLALSVGSVVFILKRVKKGFKNES